MADAPSKLNAKSVNLHYGAFHALKDISLDIRPNDITAFIGPSGCGKSSLLRVFNRMNDRIKGVRVAGEARLDGVDILGPDTDLIALRKRVGMVFQKPNPFPISVFENVAYGPRVHGERDRARLERIVEDGLRATGLWEDLRDRLTTPALSLPPEQQQRLCLSRLLAVGPEVLLMDEPCSTLDPVATTRIEELLLDLRKRYSIVIVTHNMQQAARISDRTAYFLLGELVEMGPTSQVFTNPGDRRTEDYITGRYG